MQCSFDHITFAPDVNHDSRYSFWFLVKIKIFIIMPLLEFKSFEKLPKKKPFRFLSGVFRRGGSEDRELEAAPGGGPAPGLDGCGNMASEL